MAIKTVNGKFYIKRNSSAQWSLSNPILNAGELGYDTTLKIIKVGDGTTTWNSLMPISEENYTLAEKLKLSAMPTSSELTTALNGKEDKVAGKGLSTEDYTTTEKNKLAGVETGANKYEHPTTHPVSMITGLSVAAISGSYNDLLNKPTIPDTSTLMPISGGVLENYREKLVTLSGTSTAINLSLGNVFTHTLSGNTTYTITNAVNGQAHSFTLMVNQTATVRTLTFPASVKWQGGEIPDMTTASKTYILTFMTIDGGTNWLGMFGGEF